MKGGGGPVRYTGWTVPSYNQSQQQYGYSSGQQGAYDMNNYPQQGQYPQQQGGYSYQGPPNASPQGPGAAGNTPAYFDATQTKAGRSMDRCLGKLIVSWICTTDLPSSGWESVKYVNGMERGD